MDSKKTGAKANLKKYISIDGKWRFVPVLKSEGKPRPEFVLVDGTATRSKSGTFYIEWRENGKRKQRPAGTTPREALDAWRLQCATLTGELDISYEDQESTTEEKITIRTAVANYLREVQAMKSAATHRAYSRDLAWFEEVTSKHYVRQLKREDIISLFAAGREQGLNQKTINKRAVVVLNAMRKAGAELKLHKGDWPRTVTRGVEVYEREELQQFFQACDGEELLLFQTFLCSGFRAREIATLSFADVSWKSHALVVRPKPELKFTPKSYEERIVPVPQLLIAKYKKERTRRPDDILVFPTKLHPKRPHYGGASPDAHHLELCKEIAHRAGLNCRRCKTAKGKCTEGPYCERWYLHKWRHTFATNMLQSGVDIKTLQVLLGHKNIATTEKYLRSLRNVDLRQKVEMSSLATILV